MRTGTKRAWPFIVLGLVAAIVGWSLWVRSGKTAGEGPALPASAASARGAPRVRAAAARTPTHGSVAGRVTDPGGAPIPGATVCAAAASGRMPFEQGEPTCAPAAQDGRYQLAGLPPARFTLLASAPGHRPTGYTSPEPGRARFLDLRAGEARTGVDFTLPPGGTEIRGQVKDVGGGVIAGALVTIQSWMVSYQGAVVTRSDAQGSFSAWVEEGHYMARAAADGYAEGWKDGAAPGPPIDILLTPGSVLVGRVVEAGTGAPVAGAAIDPGLDMGGPGPSRAGPASSDEDGRFRVAALAPGRYKPIARAQGGFGQARESVLLGVGQTSSEVIIELRSAPRVAGRVLVAPGGGPCPTGFVGLISPTGGGMLHAAVEEGGSVHFDGVLPGSYQVMVSCPDHATEPEYPPVEINGVDVEGLVWTVRAGLSIRGRVVDRDDKPVRAAVNASPTGGAARASGAFAQSEDDGSFVLRGLLPGKYAIMAHARDHIPPEPVEVELVDERAPDVTIVVDSGGTVEGSVTDEDHRPIAGAQIMLMGHRGGGWGLPARSLGDGSFALRGIAPGDYRVWAVQGGSRMRAPGQRGDGDPGVPVTVTAGTTARVRLVVERQGGEISGRVVDEGGEPVTDAFIDADRESETPGAPTGPPRGPWGRWSSTQVLTDPEGEFVLANLSQGTYTVHAYRRGGGSAFVEHVKVGGAVTLTIQRAGALAGTLSMAGGGSPDQFTIRVVSEAAGFFRSEAFVFTDGAWTISDVPEGKFEISAVAPEGTATAEVALARGERRSGVVLTLSPRAAVRGQVLSLQDGAPIAGVSVRAVPRGGMSMATPMLENKVTDQAGHFEIAAVSVGPTLIFALPGDPMRSEHDMAAIPVDVAPGAATDVGRIFMAKRRLKPGELPGDLGFTLKMPPPEPYSTGPHEVAEVRPDGPAAAAGLQVGDVIVSVDRYEVTGKMGYLYHSLVTVPEGTRVTLGLARGASVALVAAKMAPSPDHPPPGGLALPAAPIHLP